ncbi:retrovirus-related Pol polyprotein from transposon TNT 1-94 isoform X1 [Gossypium australe]|uniref:Retrovirus-related Pol polyprotein from transposon TNT 1-94 isoform X1 n=1 Tax=Gossypium australe TaxID=47621 RepID=A0A5B6VUI9_9ROSI|nr:retrovirus-related Pol polyprotein from transposon TNT 1-94 isoform X1 [Gossypium australe]
MTYYGKLKQLWEELANYEQISIYCFGKCNCNIAAELNKKREENRLYQFFMGLEDALYGTIRSDISRTDPLPNLNKAYSLEEHEEVVNFAVQAKIGGRKYKTKKKETNQLFAHIAKERDIILKHVSNSLDIHNGGVADPKGLDVDKGDRVQGKDVVIRQKVNTAYVIGQPSSSVAII